MKLKSRSAALIPFLVLLSVLLAGAATTGTWPYPEGFTPADHMKRNHDCQTCHEESRESLRPASHGRGSWQQEHGTVSRRKEMACSACHETKDCLTCHKLDQAPMQVIPERSDLLFPHRPGWRNTHGEEAETRGTNCLICHRVDRCTACHERMKTTTTATGTTEAEAVAVHPEGFMVASSNDFHGKQVRRDPVLCAACHEPSKKASDLLCTECHSSGGTNPHPSSWRDHMNSRGAVQHENATVCYTCHSRDGLCAICHGGGGSDAQSTKVRKKMPRRVGRKN